MTAAAARLTPLLFLAASTVLLAQPSGAPPVPTVITSESADIRSTDVETTSVFDTHVHVTGTNMELFCDHLTIVTNRVSDRAGAIGKQTGFKSLLATGHVRILQTEGQREATCGRAEVFPNDDKIVLTEHPVVTDHANGSVATGTEIDLLRAQRRVAGKNVQITFPPIKDLGFDKHQKPASAPASQPQP